MGLNSKIEWTNHTWNPWIGCHKVSTGCANCYMFRELSSGRFGKRDPEEIHRTMPGTFYAPLRWNIKAHARGVIESVFVCSWSDFFIQEARHWQTEAFEIMRQCRNLRFLLVTKRVERIAEVLRYRLPRDWSDEDWDNLWLIPTVENQEMANKRIPIALSSPFRNYGLSIEPSLGPMDYLQFSYCPEHDFHSGFCHGPCPSRRYIKWVILGGESGPDARPMNLNWARRMRDDCQAAGIPFFFKQWGEWVPDSQYELNPSALEKAVSIEVRLTARGNQKIKRARRRVHKWPDGTQSWKIGKKLAGRMLDRREWSQTPW